ncbi:MAG: GNAT family N-acetyltransferase [Oscillospiraceae bacterium]|nr:GNAT family N-acetyltransferase [Oscillospiraceae bacterium]
MLYLRKATPADIDLIYEWANDPVVRSASFNTAPIPYEDHKKWYDGVMRRDDVQLFVLMDDESPAGQIRLNIDGDEAEISYSISAAFRGKGYGRKMLRLMTETIRSDYREINTLIAKVKPENAASKALFEGEGYETEYICYSYGFDSCRCK